MLNRMTTVLLGGALLAASGASSGFGLWGDVYPPLSPEDVEALGTAADQVDEALEQGDDGTVSWRNDRTGTHGTVQGLGKTERAGRECRNYRLFIKVQGFEPYHVEPVMCKMDDGKWKFAAGLQ